MFTKSARLYDAIYSFKDYVAEADLLHAAISSSVPAARTLLDVACGTGLHLEQLRTSYDVTGVDVDPELLRLAAERNPGTPLVEADMVDFDLNRTFDVVTCLFSSIAYVRTAARLRQATAAMVRHLAPGGVLIVEPWIFPEQFETGRADALVVDFEGGKISRTTFSERREDESVLDLHYLLRDAEGEVSHFSERHVLGLFSDADYREAIGAAGLQPATFEPDGLMGRGLYIATRST